MADAIRSTMVFLVKSRAGWCVIILLKGTDPFADLFIASLHQVQPTVQHGTFFSQQIFPN